MRREYIRLYVPLLLSQGLPLHAQGIHFKFETDDLGHGITPACAGNTNPAVCRIVFPWDYPCMRREYKKTHDVKSWGSGLPLHAQGIHYSVGSSLKSTGITPACAGNTSTWIQRFDNTRDYPCMRREYLLIYIYDHCLTGLPLHAQGIHDSF